MHKRFKKITEKLKHMHFSVRWVIAAALILGGLLWFLPILGIWMIPLGLLLLAPDFKWARRGYLSIIMWMRKFRKKPKVEKAEKKSQ